MKAPLPPNEAERLETLRGYDILDTAREQVFDNLTLLAAHICQTPISLVSFVDERRQWFKSRVGLEALETSRDLAFCAYTILKPDEVMEVRDAQLDPRFADNALVTGDPNIRFYAGAPLVAFDGHALGTLCVIDRIPRALSAEQLTALRALAHAAVSQLDLHRVLAAQRYAEQALLHTKEELESANASLEQKVAMRTSELRQEIEERKQLLATTVESRRALLGILEDQQRAETALSESHARLKKVLEVETVGVMFWDLTTGCMTDANDTFLNIMGYSRRDVEARELTWQKLTPPEYFEVSLAETQKFQTTGRVGPYEKEYLRKDGTRQWFVFAGSSLGGNTCVEFCVDITERKRAEQELQESHRQLETLSRRLLVAQETERRQVARELHDEIGQLLTVIKLDLQTVLRQPGTSALAPALKEGMESVDRVIARVRDLSLDLRPSMLDDLGLAPTLRWYVQRQMLRLGVDIALKLPPSLPRLASEIETACFRIVQEALTNIARHASATHIEVTVTLATPDSSVVLTVHDDGQGFDVAAAHRKTLVGGSFGLLGMQERAELAGGIFHLASGLGQGTTIEVRFPLPDPEREIPKETT